jgi:hypothetical protein
MQGISALAWCWSLGLGGDDEGIQCTCGNGGKEREWDDFLDFSRESS